VRNGSDGVARFVMVSNRAEVNAIIYPDSDKVSVRTPHESGRFRRGDGVDYWEGES
jgi:uncharacterized cupin superfamily protein